MNQHKLLMDLFINEQTVEVGQKLLVTFCLVLHKAKCMMSAAVTYGPSWLVESDLSICIFQKCFTVDLSLISIYVQSWFRIQYQYLLHNTKVSLQKIVKHVGYKKVKLIIMFPGLVFFSIKRPKDISFLYSDKRQFTLIKLRHNNLHEDPLSYYSRAFKHDMSLPLTMLEASTCSR